MEIRWLGHSCFQIKGNKATIITDPYAPDLGYSLGKRSADIVTISHQHPGHSYFEGIDGEPKRVAGPGEYEISGILVIGMATFHDGEGGGRRGKNTLYIMDVDEISVCHLGDLGHVLTTERSEGVDEVDVLMVPVGGVSTIDATVAAEVVRQLTPKVVVPMHYKTDALQRDLDPVDRFLKEMGVKEVISQPRLSFNKGNLPLTTQVFLLDY